MAQCAYIVWICRKAKVTSPLSNMNLKALEHLKRGICYLESVIPKRALHAFKRAIAAQR